MELQGEDHGDILGKDIDERSVVKVIDFTNALLWTSFQQGQVISTYKAG